MGHPTPHRRHRIPIDPRRDPYYCEWGEVVGGRIRRLRRARGMTLQEVSTRLVLPGNARASVGYLSRLERGWASPPFFTYVAIVELLGADPGRVFGPDLVDVARLLAGPLDPDEQLAPVDRHGIAAVE